jgi:hypothetical protein
MFFFPSHYWRPPHHASYIHGTCKLGDFLIATYIAALELSWLKHLFGKLWGLTPQHIQATELAFSPHDFATKLRVPKVAFCCFSMGQISPF